ncbi:DNA repair exonuclease [Candidatus Pacearchaeota archaeon]|nr:DNA repair exonuclease [Candidatus Pacearchaeota archaeon]
MVKFAHMADVHLGGWKQKPLQDLNFQSFRKAVDICIKKKLDFVLIAGDLFDSAYPPIEILKETFKEFRNLKEAKIPCFIIAGSHDYSVSGKTFLDVLENAGFCKNVVNIEEGSPESSFEEGSAESPALAGSRALSGVSLGEAPEKIILNPVLYGGVAIYGYPGKKSGLEIPDLRKIKLNDSPGMFKIFMLHTTIDKAKGTLPIDSIETDLLPEVDYYALGHMHMDFQYKNFIYPGPIFPNNFQELEDLKSGSFYIIDTERGNSEKIDLKIKDVVPINIEINDALTATELIISEIDKQEIEDKIVLLRVHGEIERGNNSDVKFLQIEEFAKSKNAYFVLRNTHDLKIKEVELDIEVKDIENVEEDTVKLYSDKNPSEFNLLIPQLINSFSIERQEGETIDSFNSHLIEEAKKILKF